MPEKDPPPAEITNALAALEQLRAENPATDYTALTKALPPLATKLALHNLDISVDALLDHARKGAEQVQLQYAALSGVQKNKPQKSYEEIVEALHDKAGTYNYRSAKHPDKTFLSRIEDQKDIIANNILKTLRANPDPHALSQALRQAAQDDNVSLIDSLAAMGANNFYNALQYALAYGRRAATTALIKHGDISVKKALEQYEFMLLMKHTPSSVCIPGMQRENKLVLLDLKRALGEFDFEQETCAMKMTALWDKKYNPRYIPNTLTQFNPHSIKMSCLSSLFEKIYLETSDSPDSFVALEDILNGYQCNKPAVKQALHFAARGATLFHTEDRVMRYLEAWGKPGKQPLHDVLLTTHIPENLPGQTPDFKSWGDAALQHGPAMARLAKYADKLRTPLKNEHGTCWSLTKTRQAVAVLAYDRGHEHPELAAMATQIHWSERNFIEALDIVELYRQHNSKNNNKKPGNAIPAITIPGADFHKDGYTFSRLPDGDIRGLALGDFTACCQHIGGYGGKCAINGFLSPNAGFYVVTHDKTDEIVAQSWAWRGVRDELVLDSLEFLPGHLSQEQAKTLCQLFAQEARKSGIKETINIGCGGNTPDMGFERARWPAGPRDRNTFSREDSTNQYVILGPKLRQTS